MSARCLVALSYAKRSGRVLYWSPQPLLLLASSARIMKMILLGIALVVSGAAGQASDLSGRWNITMDPDFRGNRAVVECTMNRTTGPVGRVRAGSKCGELRGRTATWQTPPMTKDNLVASYRAVLNESGTRLQGTWTLTGGVLNEKGNLQAQRVK